MATREQLHRALDAALDGGLGAMSDNVLETYINKLRAKSSALTDKLIAEGRGHQRHSDIIALSDPLSQEYKANSATLREATEHREYRRTHGSKFARAQAK
jgi:hypothetical protein